MPRQPGEKPILRNKTSGWDQQWQWSDGTPLNGDEEREFNLKAAGDIGNIGQTAGGDYIGQKVGWNPTIIDPSAAGASLDASQADAQRDRLRGLLGQLQQQATTGGGEWEKTLADATRRSQETAQALGQSDPTQSAGMASYDIANAKGSAAQRAVGQGDRLRAQSQMDAQDQMGGILGQQAQGDIAQSAEEARIERQRRLANQASIDQTGKNRESTESAITGSIGKMAGMSEGGRVPGHPRVFGDDEVNDTVKAKLSPGEIVIPISIAQGPNAPERAADFVRAVQNRKGGDGTNFADGGDTGVHAGSATELGDAGGYLGYFIEPHIGRTMQYDKMRGMYGAGGGGELDTSQFAQTRGQEGALASALEQRAAGNGPSVTSPMMQAGTDDTIAGAMQTQQHGAQLASVLGRSVAAQQAAGGEAAAQRGAEQSRGQQAFADVVGRQRGQEMQLASAQQQAGWEKTLSDVGLSLEQQQQLRGSISGAGQAAAAFSGLGKGKGGGEGEGPTTAFDTPDAGYLSEGAGPAQQSESGDYSLPGGDETNYAAYGGVMEDDGRVEDFLAALKRRKVAA